jgi:hypothetical protein
VPSSFRAAVIV